MRKRILALALGTVLLISLLLTASAQTANSGSASKTTYINNADLMPKYVPDSQVKLLENNTPEWVKSLLLVEVNIRTATPEGTLDAAIKVLDHYQEMGINGIWLNPVFDAGELGNGYSNLGPHTIDPRITGTTNYAEGWKKLKNFIDEAHKRNIRIILDIISWGTVTGSDLIKQHPDWYYGEAWGHDGFNWNNEEFKEWYIQQIVDIAVKTGCDGFRYDVEPGYAGYAVGKEIRERLLAKGRKLVMIGEVENERNGAYDMEQNGVGNLVEEYTKMRPAHMFLDKYNIVDSIKNGENIGSQYSQSIGDGGGYRFYTHCISNHDFYNYAVQGNRLAIGYQAIFAPFIPLWYIGEEWINPRVENNQGVVIYFNKIDWSLLDKPENRKFYEDVKAMIRVRLQNPQIFTYFPEIHRETNICKVDVSGVEDVQPYARFYGNEAILVVPNYNQHYPNAKMTVYLPFEDMGLENYKSYVITDAITGEKIASGNRNAVYKFTTNVPYQDARVFKVVATGKINTTPSTEPEDIDDEYTETEETEETETEPTEETEPISEETEATTKPAESTQKTEPVKDTNSGQSALPIIILCVIGGAVVIGVAALLIIRNVKKKKSNE